MSGFEDIVSHIDAPRMTETMTIGERAWTRYETETMVGWVEVGKIEEGKNG